VNLAYAERAVLALNPREDVCAVVSDVAMPGLVNGFDLARRLNSSSPQTGVILLSGVMKPTGHPLPRGVRFLSKPVKASTLLRLVREVDR
jgi:FixJ family two-component response regulator